MNSAISALAIANMIRFIEENHEYKLKSHTRQSAQVSQPGRPSQDMMSFWGLFLVAPCFKFVVDIFQDTNLKLCAYCPLLGMRLLENTLRIEKMK